LSLKFGKDTIFFDAGKVGIDDAKDQDKNANQYAPNFSLLINRYRKIAWHRCRDAPWHVSTGKKKQLFAGIRFLCTFATSKKNLSNPIKYERFKSRIASPGRGKPR
jgi:hypothetical protein